MMNLYLIGIGGFFGFMTFVVLLETAGMGKIIWRDGEFTPNGVLKYMKSPFLQDFLWHPKLWRHNWILMTGLGSALGGALGCAYSYFFSS